MDKERLNNEQDELEKEFIDQLTPFQQIAYKIAVKNLESSFCIEKCIGFLEYKHNREKQSIPPS